MHIGVRQGLVLERRVGKVPGQLGTAGDQRRRGVGVRDGDGVVIEAIELLVAPLLGSCVLQEARLHRHTHRRYRDAVVIGEIGDGLDLGIVAHQVVGKVTEGGDGLDVLLAAGTAPDGQQRPDAGTGNVDGTGEQRIIHGRAAGELGPVDLDIEAFLLTVFFDEVLVAHHVEQQVDDAELLGDANLTFSLRHRRGDEAAGQQADTQAERGGQPRKWNVSGHGHAPNQKGASPWMVVRYSLRRRWLGQPVARWISERLSQNTKSWGCQWWR